MENIARMKEERDTRKYSRIRGFGEKISKQASMQTTRKQNKGHKKYKELKIDQRACTGTKGKERNILSADI